MGKREIHMGRVVVFTLVFGTTREVQECWSLKETIVGMCGSLFWSCKMHEEAGC
jgi:hypothetical protein